MSDEWYKDEMKQLIKLIKDLKLNDDQIADLFAELNDLFRAIRNECAPLKMMQLMVRRDKTIYKLKQEHKMFSS